MKVEREEIKETTNYLSKMVRLCIRVRDKGFEISFAEILSFIF